MKSEQKSYKYGQHDGIARFGNNSNAGYYRGIPICNICYQLGHLARDCNKSAYQPIQCFRCQGFGHIARNCTALAEYHRHKNAKNSGKNSQSSSQPTNTKSRPLNLSYTTETTAVPSTQTIQNGKEISRKQKKDINGIRLTVKGNRKVTNLETLANELLLSLFEYLSTADRLCAFHGLNSRFETLLFDHFLTCHLDFRSLSKQNSKMICQQYLPLMKDQLISIRLSDGDPSLKQTNLLSSCGVTVRQFNSLRSLSLCYIRCEQTMNRMMIEWQHLPNLTHLKLIKCHSSFRCAHTTHLSNIIWSLHKLTHCYVDTDKNVFYMPKKISLSIECVSILGHDCRLKELSQLLEKTPRLRSISIRHHDLNDNQYLSSPVLSITTLKLHDIHSRSVMMNLLQNMTNLSHLMIETLYLNLDGYQWEQIIIHHLPYLQVFRLKMDIQLTGYMNNEQQVDILLDSFRTRFWIEERQWFVRCHRKPEKNHSDVLLYTIPMVFRDFNKKIIHSPFKSTGPNNKEH